MTRPRDDVGQFVQGLDLVGNDAAHGGRLLRRFLRQGDGVATQFLTGRFEFALNLARHAAHVGCGRLKARRRLAENILDFGAGLFIGRPQQVDRAVALAAD